MGRRTKIWLSIGGAIAGLPVAVLSAILIFGNMDIGQRYIEKLAPMLTDNQVTLEGLSGRFPDRLQIRKLDIRDKAGLWLSLGDTQVDWSPLSILFNRINVETLAIGRVNLIRLPESSSESSESDLKINIDHLSLDKVIVGASGTVSTITLNISGKFHYTTLDDFSIDVLGNEIGGNARYLIDVTSSEQGLQGLVDIQENAQGFLSRLAGLPHIGPITVLGKAAGPLAAQKLDLTFQAGELSGFMRGSMDRIEKHGKLSFAIKAPAMAPSIDISWGKIDIEGDIEGPIKTPRLNGNIALASLKMGETMLQSLEGIFQGQNGALDTQLVLRDLRVSADKPRLFSDEPLQLNLTAQLNRDKYPTLFELSHRDLMATGQVLWGNAITSQLNLEVKSLSIFAQQAGLDLEGQAKAKVSLTLNGTKKEFVAEGQIDAQGQQLAARLIGNNAEFFISAYQAGRKLNLRKAEFESRSVHLDINGQMDGKLLNFNWNMGLRDLSRFAEPLRGNVNIQGIVQGKIDLLDMRANISGAMGSVQFRPEPLNGSIKLTGLPGRPAGEIKLSGSLEKSPLTIRGTLSQRETSLHLLIDHTTWKSLKLIADLDIPHHSNTVAGIAKLNVGKLSDLGNLAKTELNGSLETEVKFAPRHGDSDLHFRINGHDLRVASIFSEHVSGEGHASGFFKAPQLMAQINIHAFSSPGLKGDGNIKITGPLDALNAEVRSDFHYGNAPGKLVTSVLANLSKKNVSVHTFSMDFKEEKIELESSSRISFHEGISLDTFKMAAAGAQIMLTGQLTPQLDMTASGENITARLVKILSPSIDFEGRFETKARLTGTVEAPRGEIELSGHNLKLTGGSDMSPARFTGSAVLEGQYAQIDAKLGGGKDLILTAQGRVPLQDKGTLDIKLKGATDLAFANPVLNADGRNLRGKIQLDVEISGTTIRPNLIGLAQISDVDFQDYGQGVHISELSGQVDMDGMRVSLSNMKAKAGNGTLSAVGYVDLSNADMPIDIAITAKSARLLAGNLVTLDADASLKLKGTLKTRTRLAGDIKVTRGDVNIPEKLPPGVAVLDVRRKGEHRDQPAPPKPPRIELDLQLNAPNRVFVRGRGLEAELSGKIHIGGDMARPAVTGGFDLRRGDFSLAGQTLKFTRGKVVFDGRGVSSNFDPALDFMAESVSGDIIAKLQVTGYASSPKISLSSSPTLPQDEVLAQLLFQQSVKELGPMQMAQIAEALGTLTGVGSGLGNPLSGLRKGLGLDRLSVGSDSGGASVEAGKYIASGIYVGAKQDMAGGTRAQVQIDLTEHLKLQSTINTGNEGAVSSGPSMIDRGSNIGLSYQFEY